MESTLKKVCHAHSNSVNSHLQDLNSQPKPIFAEYSSSSDEESANQINNKEEKDVIMFLGQGQ